MPFGESMSHPLRLVLTSSLTGFSTRCSLPGRLPRPAPTLYLVPARNGEVNDHLPRDPVTSPERCACPHHVNPQSSHRRRDGEGGPFRRSGEDRRLLFGARSCSAFRALLNFMISSSLVGMHFVSGACVRAHAQAWSALMRPIGLFQVPCSPQARSFTQRAGALLIYTGAKSGRGHLVLILALKVAANFDVKIRCPPCMHVR